MTEPISSSGRGIAPLDEGCSPFWKKTNALGCSISSIKPWEGEKQTEEAERLSRQLEGLRMNCDIQVNLVVQGKPTPLTWAVFRGNMPLVKYFLEHGADPNLVDGTGMSPLGSTTKNTSLSLVDLLVQKGADINRVAHGVVAPLTWAVFKDNMPLVKYFLEHGADPNLVDGAGMFPLSSTTKSTSLSLVDLLVQKGADINRVVYDKATALTWAVFKDNMPLVKYFLEHGADPNLVDGAGVSPLGSITKSTSPLLIDLLVQKGADINRVVYDGATALTWAVFKDNMPIVEYFLEHGADPNLVDGTGISPLGSITKSTSPSLVDLLVQKGADINRVICGKTTPLTQAVFKGNMPLVEYFLEHGADPNGFDGEGVTPLMWAQASKHSNKEKILATLFRWGANETGSLLYTSMKMAAHYWTLGGGVGVQTITGLRTFSLEGLNIGITPPPLADYFIRFISDGQKFRGPLFSQAQLKVIQDTLEQMVPRVKFVPQKIVQRIQEGHPFFWLKTFAKPPHAIGLVFYSNHIYVCDRSPKDTYAGSYANTIDMYGLDANFFQRVENATDVSELDSLLGEAGARWNRVSFFQKRQKVSNCAWTGAKSGFRALIKSVFLESGYGYEASDDKAEAIYKSFTTFTRIHSLDEYLASCGSQPPNKEFIEKIREKILEKPQPFGRNRFDQATKERLLRKAEDALMRQ